jgi:predicted permease
MSIDLLIKLFAIVVVVSIGYAVGRARWLSPDDRDGDPARTLSYAAYYIFVPALLFHTTARIELAALPWRILGAFFVPVTAVMLALYAWQRRWNRNGRLPAAAPGVRALVAVFGNTVQVGIPMAAALFGPRGVALHVTVISLHALTLLTVQTGLVELDLAREQQRAGGDRHLGRTLLVTARNTVVHPVVLPVLGGLAWNAAGLAMPAVMDEILVLLGQAVVPLCLVLIGTSLAYYGIAGSAKGAGVISVVKLLVLPAIVLGVGRFGLGLEGLPLAVIVMCAALPVGSNAVIFSQRYGALQAETTAAAVFSTLGFAVTAPLWIAVLDALGILGHSPPK